MALLRNTVQRPSKQSMRPSPDSYKNQKETDIFMEMESILLHYKDRAPDFFKILITPIHVKNIKILYFFKTKVTWNFIVKLGEVSDKNSKEKLCGLVGHFINACPVLRWSVVVGQLCSQNSSNYHHVLYSMERTYQ